MEAALEFPERLEEKEVSADENNGQDPALSKESEMGVQHGDPSGEDSGRCRPVLWETLGRQFEEYGEMADVLSPEERRRRLFAFMPLFLKAWEQLEGEISFPDIHLFASEASDLLVKEIKKSMNGKPAEAARQSVWRFLQGKAEEEIHGYVLLRALYVLLHAPLERGTRHDIIQSGLPITLLQCLYLFFAFHLDEDGGGTCQGERQVQEVLVQIMLNLCAEEQGVEQLLMTSDLQSLIIATASLWNQGSPSWKGPTSCVLRAISKVPSQNIISYLQATDCVKMSIQNLSKLMDSLSPCDVCEVLNILLCFVKNSYTVSPALLSEFENNGGYQLLLTVFLRYDGPLDGKEDTSLQETLDILTQLTVCGQMELKVSGNMAHPQLPQFSAEHEALAETAGLDFVSSGNRVRNLKAFQVLESLFRKTSNPALSQRILLAMKSIWTWDPVNFFLLEWSLQPIAQFVGLLPLKPPQVQTQFFQLVESVVLDFSYIPHDILKEIQGLIKENADPLSTSAALCCLRNIAQKDALFTDIFRDSGLLGMLLVQLRKEAKILRRKGGAHIPGCQEDTTERELISRMLKMVNVLLVGSVRNTVVLRDYGMVPYIKIFLDDRLYRSDTLTILEQLSVVNPEEYMSIVVGALCSSTQGELDLKLDLLKSLLRMLEHHRGRSAFRTSSGFNGLLSLLSDMEGALRDPPSAPWSSFGRTRTMELLSHTLHALAAALHSDPVNSDFFRKNGLFEKLAEDLVLLGCFTGQKGRLTFMGLGETRSFAEFLNAAVGSAELLPPCLKSCMWIFRFLDQMATGSLFRPRSCSTKMELGVEELLLTARNHQEETEDVSEQVDDKGTADCQWLEPKERSACGEELLVHPGALGVMVRLLPELYNDAYPELSWEIQLAVACHIQSLMRVEKNRQVACGAGLLDIVVSCCQDELRDAHNLLHLPLLRLFEKLASQSIEPDVLRQFLCLRTPLLPLESGSSVSPVPSPLGRKNGSFRKTWEEGSLSDPANCHLAPPVSVVSRMSENSVAALEAATSLIAMTAPRNFQPQSACLAPSFVEFDMSLKGYGCLFLPTLATVLGPNAEHSISGGIGKGPRLFPSPDGLTFSSWFLVSKRGSAHDAPHPLRFLTLVRHMARTEEEFVCFSVSFSPESDCLTVSTEETPLQPLDLMEPKCENVGQSSAFSRVQFSCAGLLVTGQWHHLAVTAATETKRICIVSAYLDGQLLGSAKMQYIQLFPGNFVSMDPSSFIDVYGYMATPRVWNQKSPLTWRQGPIHFFEEAVSVETLQRISSLGPRYCGSFQDVELGGEGSSNEVRTGALVAQEKISFGINVMSSSYTTIRGIRDHYGEVDGRLIAKELELSSRDGMTPVYLARNIAGKLPGPLRTIGAVAVGQYGTRVFQTCPAAVSLNYIGGPALLLGLLTLAGDDSSMYATVKALHSVLSSSTMSENQMRQIGGYQILAYLLQRKIHLLNSRILQLILSIGGIAETSIESLTIKNPEAFQYVLCNFELWCHGPENLDLSLFTHLTEILQPSRDGHWNAKLAHQMQMVPKLLLLFDAKVPRSRVSKICAVLSGLLQGHFSIQDTLRISLFLVYTLSPFSVDENKICLDQVPESLGDALSQTSGNRIWLRNQLLKMLLDVLCSDQLHPSSEMREDVFQALGPDWFLMFIQSHVHMSTVVLVVRLLLHFLHNRSLLCKFKEGMMAGLWLENSSRGLSVLMDNLKSGAQVPECSPYLLYGFVELKAFLSNCVHIPEIYFLLSGLLLATPVCEPPEEPKADLDAMLQWLLRNHMADSIAKVGLCPEAAVLLLEMVKATVNRVPADAEDCWELSYLGHIMQFFCMVHRRHSQDPLWCNSDFLQALALVVFPSPQGSPESDSSTSRLPLPFTLDPARKPVWDFTCRLLMEMLLVVPAHRHWHPMEMLLEASAESSTADQRKHFQTEMLVSIMDVFPIIVQEDEKRTCSLGRNDAARNTLEPTTPTLLVNLSYLTQKLVEKLSAGAFVGDPRKIIVFLVEQVSMALQKVPLHTETILSVLYGSLNRAILCSLSGSTSDQPRLLSILRTLQQQRDTIFATQNSSPGFIPCLLHCLSQLRRSSSSKQCDAKQRMPSAQRIFQAPGQGEQRTDHLPVPENVQEEIWKSTEDIWNQLLSQRRLDLEDAYKMALSVESVGGGDWKVKIGDLTPQWEETVAKAWQQFLASEKKTPQNKVLAQTCSKTRPWSGSLSSAMKLAAHKNIKQMGYHAQLQAGPSFQLCAATTSETHVEFGDSWNFSGLGLIDPQNFEYPKKAEKHQPSKGERVADCGQLTFFPALHESYSEDLLEVCVERRIILQEFAEDEKVTGRESVVIVQGHVALEGVLLFGQKHFYICEYFTLSHPQEVYCTRHCLSSISDSFIYTLCYKDQAMGQPACSCYSYDDIKEIHPMRFLLQEVAVEIFFRSGYSVFLAFHNSARKKPLKRFWSKKPSLKSRGITEESINVRRSTGGEKNMLLKWQRREISNFEYLMYLNTLAGRTYSDLMQYPVFPWILADYHSQTLDLTNPAVFRDLSKPMGAQTAERKEKFVQRYKDIEKTEGELSAQCHYCTHYSSAIIVASYLVRIEPFTQIYCSLQGGGFDVADRMFHSLKSTWDSVSRQNMTDVRELTPEFFYLPEFLTNCNQFEFGSLQDGTLLGDVELPPWAEGSPHRFISLNRQALESDYVSSHLHHWIDLIFGHKQHGPAAVKALNVFHPYFYGDQVHLDSISDPLTKNTVLGFSSNFGQIPKQLFTKPHPARNALGKHPVGRDGLRFSLPAGQLLPPLSSLHNLKFSSVPTHLPSSYADAPQGPVGHIVCTDKGVLAVEKNKILLPPQWNKVFCWGFDDFTCCLASYGSDKNMATFEAPVDWGSSFCAVCPTPTTLITSGSSSVVCTWELFVASDGAARLRLKKPLYGHRGAVTCLASSASYGIVVSGSADRSGIIWDLHRLTRLTRLPAHQACLSAVAVNDSTGNIASCAGETLYVWNINGKPLARLNSACRLGSTLSCCCFMEVMDGDVPGLIVAGDTGGRVQVWKLENAPAWRQDIGTNSRESSAKQAKLLSQASELRQQEPDLLCSSEGHSRSSEGLLTRREYARVAHCGREKLSCSAPLPHKRCQQSHFGIRKRLTIGACRHMREPPQSCPLANGFSVSKSILSAATGSQAEIPFILCQELDLSTTPPERPGRAAASVTTLAVSRNYSKLLAGDDSGKIFCWSVDE
uniref:WD repeat- and FYVE domain-containing protein 4 n=1 Tax=Euleptes europaea TaxID=460621 RepID=UPI002541D780|nr:WD repeat- and FYVE domain-containing protein 4 [Euleptes europaea]